MSISRTRVEFSTVKHEHVRFFSFFFFFEIERKREQIERDYVKVVPQVVRGDYFVCNREDVLYVYGNNGTEMKFYRRVRKEVRFEFVNERND